MPFIQQGLRKRRRELPIDDVKASCEVISELLIDKNRKGIKIFCDSVAKRFVIEDVSFSFSSSHTKLGHSIKMEASFTVEENEYVEKRQTPYYSEQEYTPKETGVFVFRDLIYMIMSVIDVFTYAYFYKSYDGFSDMEQATFELLKVDVKDYNAERDRIDNSSSVQSSK